MYTHIDTSNVVCIHTYMRMHDCVYQSVLVLLSLSLCASVCLPVSVCHALSSYPWLKPVGLDLSLTQPLLWYS